MAFIPGHSVPVAFYPQGSLQGTTLKIVGWSGAEEVPVKERTHSQSRGLHACVTGRLLWTATVMANLDTVLYPWRVRVPGLQDINLRAGTRGIMLFYVVRPQLLVREARFDVGVRVTKINHASAVAGTVSWSLDVLLDSSVVPGSPATAFLYPDMTFAQP